MSSIKGLMMKKLMKVIVFLAAATFLMQIEDWYQVHNPTMIQELSIRIPSPTGWQQTGDLAWPGTPRGAEATPVSADLGT